MKRKQATTLCQQLGKTASHTWWSTTTSCACCLCMVWHFSDQWNGCSRSTEQPTWSP